ncbi:MAG: DUF2071 domain-containing protein [Planctomycetota bacterium]
MTTLTLPASPPPTPIAPPAPFATADKRPRTPALVALAARLRRHPFAVQAHFRHCLVLTYAADPAPLAGLLPPGLTLDTFRGRGFLAVALVQTQALRPAGFPAFLGQNFFLAGYRLFVRHRTAAGRTLRGLFILRSETDAARMVLAGNLLTHYRYIRCQSTLIEHDGWLEATTRRPATGEITLHVAATLPPFAAPNGPAADAPAPTPAPAAPIPPPPALPDGSPFQTHREARRFAGPLPFTFDYDPTAHGIVRIEGRRSRWLPVPVRAAVLRNAFLDAPPFAGAHPVLAAAFHLHDIDYRWRRGVFEPLPQPLSQEIHP